MKPDISLVSASAGSGKTYRLTRILVEEIGRGTRPEGVLAATFTKKAANELVGRVRAALLEAGKPQEALRVLDGYIGTVHSVCGALLKDFAFDAGLSPTLDVLPEGRDDAAFRIAMSPVVERATPRALPCLKALDIEIGDWEGMIKDIADAARANGIDRAGLLDCAEKSWASFRRLLPTPEGGGGGQALDMLMAEELGNTIRSLPAHGDETKGTLGAKKKLVEIWRRSEGGVPGTWADWVRLSKTKPAKGSDHLVEVLRDLASRHLTHPRLHEDLETLIRTTFDCAAEAQGLYAQYKKDLGLIDFTDQESLALSLLGKESVVEALRERLDLVLVDEFQDTNPLQLALYLRLAALAGRSVWVGDQKQAIYGFLGADPILMDRVIDSLGQPEVLECSWRSQPELVRFSNEFFSLAFGRQGVPGERVRLVPRVLATAPVSPHLKCFRLEAVNNGEEVEALAGAVSDLLRHAADHAVLDKGAGRERPLRPGDVAILCRTNVDCSLVAEALEAAGVRAAIPRGGLMARPESVLVLAAFRYLVDKEDSLAVAEMARLLGDTPGDFLGTAVDRGMEEVKAGLPVIARLDAARGSLIRLTPSETLGLAMELVDAQRAVLGWGEADKRLGNLDALRGLAADYEEYCHAGRCACTPTGLVSFLEEMAAEGTDMQSEGVGDEAVQVLTYHRSKGLEWPLVVLTGLDSKPKGSPFGLKVESPGGAVDLADPLAGRWIRYWPWPYGQQKIVEGFSREADTCREALAVADAEEREMLRLLYVGMTRARDHLVFAARLSEKSSKTDWLEACLGHGGLQILELPTEEGRAEIMVGSAAFAVETKVVTPAAGRKPERLPVHSPVRPAAVPDHPPARFAPSAVEMEGEVPVELLPLGDPYDVGKRRDAIALGLAVHAFLAVDRPEVSLGQRQARAESTLKRKTAEGPDARTLTEMSDRLWSFLRQRYGEEVRIDREWPIALRRGLQRSNGWIDLVVRLDDGDVLIDHKTSDGDDGRLEAKARGYAGQLAVYREAWEKATGRKVLETLIHFPVAGKMAILGFNSSGGKA